MKPRLIPILGVLLLLAGCTTQRILLCPAAAILADTAIEPVFRPGAPHDLSGVAYSASVANVKTDCLFDRKTGTTVSSLDIDFRATRSPTADSAGVTVAYFVTINASERVLDKQMQSVHFDFAPGSTVATAAVSLDPKVTIELERGHLPTDYQLLVGFQLTPEQLAFNRTMGRYVP